MIILPAIDLKDGKCVRLQRGDFDTVHTVASSPLETAADFCAAGAEMIHMVDLDGARDGVRKNAAIVRGVCGRSGMRIELGGGIRSMEDIEAAEELGVFRFIIGSAAVTDEGFVRKAVDVYGDRIAVGVDCRGGVVCTHGWERVSGLRGTDFVRRMEDIGVAHVIFTDIETDGMLSGPPIRELEGLRKLVSCGLIASGGVSSHADIRTLRDIGMDGVIIGKAYYAGKIDLALAIKEAGE